MKNLAIALCIFCFVSCKEKKQSVEEKDKTKTESSEKQVGEIINFKVSFISIGSGIDIDAKKSYEEFIKSFENQNKLKLTFEKNSWGREGEIDFCFMLNDIDSRLRVQFINQTKEHLKGSKLVRYYENVPCSNRN